MTEKTEEQRIAIIRDAHLKSKGLGLSKSAESLVEEILTEQTIGDNGLFKISKHDIDDECELIDHKQEAEVIDEEDEIFPLSDEVKGVYS